MASQLDIIVAVKENSAAAFKKITGGLGSLQKSFKDLSISQIGAIGGSVASLGKFVTAYEDSRRSSSLLANSLKNVGISFDSVKGQVEATAKALQDKTNYEDDEQIKALSTMVQLTGNYKESLKQLPNVLNLATLMQTDLSSASKDYVRLLQGELPKGLAKLIPQLKEMEDAGAPLADKLALVQEKLKGVAEADMSIIEVNKNRLNDLAEKIGEKLLPVLTDMSKLFFDLPTALQAIIAIAPIAATAFTLMGGPITVLAVALGSAYLGATKLYNYLEEKSAKKRTPEARAEQLAKEFEEVEKLKNNWVATRDRNDDSFAGKKYLKKQEDVYRKALAQYKLHAEAFNRLQKTTPTPSIEPIKTIVGSGKGDKKGKTELTDDEKNQEKAYKSLLSQRGDWEWEYKQEQAKRDRAIVEEEVAWQIEQKEYLQESRSNGIAKMRELQKAQRDEELQNNQMLSQNYASLGQSLGMALSAGIGQGAEGYKASLKAVLNMGLDMLQNKLLIATADSIFTGIITMGASVGPAIAALAAGTAAIQAAKIGVSKFENGTNYFSGGLAMVGERGPELLNLPRGSSVMNATRTYQTVNNNNSNKSNVVIVQGTDNKTFAKQLMDATKDKSIDWYRLTKRGLGYVPASA